LSNNVFTAKFLEVHRSSQILDEGAEACSIVPVVPGAVLFGVVASNHVSEVVSLGSWARRIVPSDTDSCFTLGDGTARGDLLFVMGAGELVSGKGDGGDEESDGDVGEEGDAGEETEVGEGKEASH